MQAGSCLYDGAGMYTYRQNKETYFDRLGCTYDPFLVLADDEAAAAGRIYGTAGVRGSTEPPAELLTNQNGKTRLAHSHVWENIVLQFHDWKSCIEMIDAYSTSTGVQYDWLVRHRLDHVVNTTASRHTHPLAALPPDAITVPRFAHFRGINDRQAIGPMHLMRKYST